MTTRIPLPVLAPAGLKSCTECGRCCTYVSVGINEPRTVRFASDVLWYLYHEKVSVYRDGDGDWSVVFETRCRHLRDDLLCSVYEDRPVICRDFDNTSCEVNAPEGGRSFEAPQDFLDWLRAERPAVFRRLVARFVPPALRAPARARLPL
ncbi:MAG TPA: YkgJ family cysteine cluster protein [Vicinamibacteria bacterium]|nr:YkgJ family cysteine cluster protein [Vicinamibacteria bacterium]